MVNPTTKDVESKIKVTIFVDAIGLLDLRSDIYDWAMKQNIEIYWVTCFLDAAPIRRGAHVYFEDINDAMAFKLTWL